MNKTEKYEIKLFGQNFVFTTDDGTKEDLKAVIEYYKRVVENLMEKLPGRSQLDIAILAGLKITDKLYTLINKKSVKIGDKDKDEESIDIKINEAIKRLEKSLTL